MPFWKKKKKNVESNIGTYEEESKDVNKKVEGAKYKSERFIESIENELDTYMQISRKSQKRKTSHKSNT